MYENSNFMMFFEMKFENNKLLEDFGLLKKSTTKADQYFTDSHSHLDLDRLSRFITFNMKFRKRKNG